MCEEKLPGDILEEKYPELYGNAYEVTLPHGWLPLVLKLSDDILAVLGMFTSEDFAVTCVKEKFGGLRYYTKGERAETVWDLIDQAEAESQLLCQVCGQPGKRVLIKHWLYTLCSEHEICQQR